MYNFRLIYSLVLLEALSRPGRGAMIVVSALVEPLVMLSVMAVLFTILTRGMSFGDNIVVFLSTGLIPAFASIRVAQRVLGAQSGWRRNLKMRGLNVVKFIMAIALLEASIFFVIACALLVISIFYLNDIVLPHKISLMMLGFFLMVIIGIGVGAGSLAIKRFFPVWELILMTAQRAAIFLSGFFYVVDYVPVIIRDVIVYNPLAHGIMLIRVGYYGDMYPHITMSTEYLFWWALISLLLGLFFENRTRYKLLED